MLGQAQINKNLVLLRAKAQVVLKYLLGRQEQQIGLLLVEEINNGIIICWGNTTTDVVYTLPISYSTFISCVALHYGTGGTALALDYNYRQSLTQLHFVKEITVQYLALRFICIGY